MSKRLNTSDFFICTGGLMPAQMSSGQAVAKKEDKTTYFLTHLDVNTNICVDFSCKKMMLLMALVAILIAAIIILTGGAASFIVAAAIGGVVGTGAGALICGRKASAARNWVGYATQQTLVIKGNYSLADENFMICKLFGEQIRIAPKIKNWWQAALVGISNFAGEELKCVMVGAGVAGIQVLAAEGATAFLGNALANYAWMFSPGGLAVRAFMAGNNVVQDHYVQGNEWGVGSVGSAALGFVGPELGTGKTVVDLVPLGENNTWSNTKKDIGKAESVDGEKHGFFKVLAYASASSSILTDVSGLLGWGAKVAKQPEGFAEMSWAERLAAQRQVVAKSWGIKPKGDLWSDPALKEAEAAKNSFKDNISIYDKGKTGENLTKSLLEKRFEGADIFEQIHIRGIRMFADFVVVKDGKLIGVFESKVDGSPLSDNQKLFFNEGQGGTFSGKNAKINKISGLEVDPSNVEKGVYRWDSKTGTYTIE